MIITLTGMSTSGKSTLAKHLSNNEEFDEVVSVTTRPKRLGEVDGRDYYFVSESEFRNMVEKGELLEHVHSHHASYGVPAFELERIQGLKKSAVMVLEPKGVSNIYTHCYRNSIGFCSVYINVNLDILLSRYFKRVIDQVASCRPPSYESEAKRLHVMLSSESLWVDSWDWDITFSDLHIDNKQDSAIAHLTKLHYENATAKSGYRLLECKPEKSISLAHIEKLLEEAIQNNQGCDQFVRSVKDMTKRPGLITNLGFTI